MKKYVVVTGAGHRVGFHIAKTLLLSEYNIIAHYRTNKSELEQWLACNDIYAPCCHFVQADLVKDVTPLLDEIKKENVIGLVNSASQFITGDLLDNSAFDENVVLNTMVPLLLSRAMQTKQDGFIINIIDANIERVNQSYQAYRTSKLFLKEITRQLAVTMAPNIRVNGLAPGTVLPPAGVLTESYLQARKKAPMERDAQLGDLMDALLLLVRNSSITGEVISVDCGVQAL